MFISRCVLADRGADRGTVLLSHSAFSRTEEPSLCAPCQKKKSYRTVFLCSLSHKRTVPLCFQKLELPFYSSNVILRMSPYLVPFNGTFRLPQTWNQLRVRFLSSLRYNTDWSVICFAKSLLTWIVRILLITF